MWYFAWILGVLLACSFAVVNALWLEVTEDMDRHEAEFED
ncbi:cytochrome bd-I oxidase subunit CydX [uncultured Microbulbifer sp.]|nr:cytochrome bd-I oxidase subunit CydX [uncultured Microbulbifer sp.]